MNDKDIRIILPTPAREYRLELFTKEPDGIVSIDYPALKLGEFRVKRVDNTRGERYFITDLRQKGQIVDVILIHDDESKAKIRTYGLTPIYQHQRIEVYKIGLYQSHNLYKLNIDTDGVRLINKFD